MLGVVEVAGLDKLPIIIVEEAVEEAVEPGVGQNYQLVF